MKLVSVKNNAPVHAIEKMLYLTCGEEVDILLNAVVKQIGDNDFHITYKAEDPYEGIDFKVVVTEESRHHYHYAVRESVWGDDGEFDL